MDVSGQRQEQGGQVEGFTICKMESTMCMACRCFNRTLTTTNRSLVQKLEDSKLKNIELRNLFQIPWLIENSQSFCFDIPSGLPQVFSISAKLLERGGNNFTSGAVKQLEVNSLCQTSTDYTQRDQQVMIYILPVTLVLCRSCISL